MVINGSTNELYHINELISSIADQFLFRPFVRIDTNCPIEWICYASSHILLVVHPCVPLITLLLYGDLRWKSRVMCQLFYWINNQNQKLRTGLCCLDTLLGSHPYTPRLKVPHQFLLPVLYKNN